MSPSTLIAQAPASCLIAIAQNDDAKAPQDKAVLQQAAASAGPHSMVEVYPADHGWTVPDSPAYDRAQAERAWQALQKLYSEALG